MKRKGDKMIYPIKDFNNSHRSRGPSPLHQPIIRRGRQDFQRPYQSGNKLTELIQNFSNPQATLASFANRSVGNISKTLDNVQKVLELMDKTTPVVEKYGPIVKNIPTMYKLVRAMNDSEFDKSSNEQSDTSKNQMLTSTTEIAKEQTHDQTKESKPKLYI